MDLYRAHVLVCGGTGCTSSGSHQLIERFEQQLKEKGLEKEVKVVRTGCFGLCEAGPVVIIYPEGTFYSRVKVEDVDEIVSEHLLKGRKVQHLVYVDHVTHESTVTKSLDEIGFYKQQKRIALKNCGVIDPENIDEYIAFDGYKALAKALTEMTREQVIQEVLDSGLRGRGGAGFPTLQFRHLLDGEIAEELAQRFLLSFLQEVIFAGQLVQVFQVAEQCLGVGHVLVGIVKVTDEHLAPEVKFVQALLAARYCTEHLVEVAH